MKVNDEVSWRDVRSGGGGGSVLRIPSVFRYSTANPIGNRPTELQTSLTLIFCWKLLSRQNKHYH